jgi:Tol biopolymer transport system component
MKTSLLKRHPVITAAATAVATLMLSLAGWLVWQRSHPAAPEPRPTPAPLTSYPGFALQPTFSPDSNEVAFCWNEERPGLPAPKCCLDHYDIYRKQIGGGEPLRLTRNPAGGESPAWSPDGRLIAFYQYPRQVYVMAALGGLERQVGKANFGVAGWRLNYPDSTLAWSLDGGWLVLPDHPCTENCAAPQGLFAFSVDTGERRRLTSCPENMWADVYPALSPDGRTMAFVRLQELGFGDVYLLSLDEHLQPQGEPERLTYEDLMVQSPVWTRDGKEIFFSTGAMLSERSIRSVPATPPRSRSEYHPRLETFGEDATTLAISPNGRRLAYARVSQTINIYKVAISGAAGPARKPQSIAPSSRLDREPDISPDGKRIAFVSTRSGSTEIWVCDADGSNPRQITSMGGPFTGYPKWSPDGNTMLFGSRREVMPSLYVVSATGGAPRRLTKIPAFWASWSHDGNWIYFTSYGPSNDFVFRMPASGGDAVQLGKGWIDAAESVDGKWVYFFDSGGLWKLPAVGGQPILVSKGEFHGDFALVEDGVYYTTGDWTGKAAVLFYDFGTGKTQVVAQLDKPAFKGIAISPDRRWALLTQIVHMGSDLMLVENFR